MKHYLGIDIGSSYTKVVLIDEEHKIKGRQILKTLTRDKLALSRVIGTIRSAFPYDKTCATGYGREHFKNADVTKTEILCASKAVSEMYPEEKNIIDIGGEDIKIIHSAADGKVIDFYMNTKCAAGTGTFITEIADRAELPVHEMSELASRSKYNKELNSFCTVFAKTEIMQWIFDDVKEEDVARGIYLSIANRIAKIRMEKELPLYIIGGVIGHHPFLKNIIEEKFQQKTTVPDFPQLVNAFGAALFAHQYAAKRKNETV